MKILTFEGHAEDTPKPATYYAEIAAAGRARGLDINDDDYDKIDALIEGNSMRATTVQGSRYDDPVDSLVAGYLPYEAKYEEPLAN